MKLIIKSIYLSVCAGVVLCAHACALLSLCVSLFLSVFCGGSGRQIQETYRMAARSKRHTVSGRQIQAPDVSPKIWWSAFWKLFPQSDWPPCGSIVTPRQLSRVVHSVICYMLLFICYCVCLSYKYAYVLVLDLIYYRNNWIRIFIPR